MLMLRVFVLTFAVGLIVFGAGVASGQNYPNKPIRIVTSEPGGSADFGARLIAQGITGGLGQQVIIENRPSGFIPGDTVAKAPPDGYTLLLYSNGLWTLPFIRTVPYDPVRDFSPVTLTSRAPNILVVHPSLPVKSVKELIALAKARPGALNYASSASGSANHVAGELFKSMAGVNIVRINYKGTGPLLIALMSGEVQLTFTSGGGVAPHLKSGRLKALAVASAHPSDLVPGLPTVAASGLPGYESVVITSIFAPAKTPAAIVNRLNQEIVRFLSMPETKERLLNAGVEAVGSSPDELAATVRSEIAKLGRVFKDTGIRPE